ncbi:MAG TPA: hypothetical protein VFR56_01460 [Actinomycetes bacterium]|nr:hypothetical protein [Actinomycetes bacterium]
MAGLAVALLAVVAGGAYVASDSDRAPGATRPVVLPDTFMGLGPAEASAQFAQIDTQWRDGLSDAYGDRPFDGRAYGTLAEGIRINVVVNRGDAPDVGDASFGRPPFTDFGAVACTHTLQLPETPGVDDPGPFTSARMFLCVRSDDVATVSAFALMGAQGREADVAAAVDQVWALQQ